MRADGFRRGATIHSELFALNNGRRAGTREDGRYRGRSRDARHQADGDGDGHAAQPAPSSFLSATTGSYPASTAAACSARSKTVTARPSLSEVKRQHKNDERRAAEMMAEGNFHDALGIYEQKGAIHWTRTQGEARGWRLLTNGQADSAAAPDKTRFVFAYTNDDVATLNGDLARRPQGTRRARRRPRASRPPTGARPLPTGDRIQFTGDRQEGRHRQRTRRHDRRRSTAARSP